jgi:hypothetical protein
VREVAGAVVLDGQQPDRVEQLADIVSVQAVDGSEWAHGLAAPGDDAQPDVLVHRQAQRCS